jgi:hypothetical protein
VKATPGMAFRPHKPMLEKPPKEKTETAKTTIKLTRRPPSGPLKNEAVRALKHDSLQEAIRLKEETLNLALKAIKKEPASNTIVFESPFTNNLN